MMIFCGTLEPGRIISLTNAFTGKPSALFLTVVFNASARGWGGSRYRLTPSGEHIVRAIRPGDDHGRNGTWLGSGVPLTYRRFLARLARRGSDQSNLGKKRACNHGDASRKHLSRPRGVQVLDGFQLYQGSGRTQ